MIPKALESAINKIVDSLNLEDRAFDAHLRELITNVYLAGRVDGYQRALDDRTSLS